MESKSNDRSTYQSRKCVNYDDLYPQSFQEKMELIKQLNAFVMEYEILLRLSQTTHPYAVSDIESRMRFLELSIRSFL